MSRSTPQSLVLAARRIALICALAVAVIGVVTLVGWAVGITVVTQLVPSSVAMKVDTAIALTLLGLALAAHAAPPRRAPIAAAARAAGWAAASLAAASALQWILAIDLGIDELLVADPAGGVHPGRSTPVACAGILLVAGALEIDRRRAVDRRLVNGVVGLPLLVGLLSLTGYLSGITSFTGLHGALRFSPSTGVALLLAGVAVLLARPQRSMVRLLVSPGPGGVIARRLLPIAVALPLVLDGLRLVAIHRGLVAERIGDWLLAFLILTVMAGLVLRLGRGLELLDGGRRRAEEQLRASEAAARSVTESAHDAIVTAGEHGAIVLFNPAAERLFGWTAEEVIGRSVAMLMPAGRYADSRAQLAAAARRAPVAGGGARQEHRGLTKDGRVFDLELSLAQDGGRTTAIMRDITARKELEQLVRDEAERMARVVTAHSTIVAGAGELSTTMDLVARQAGEIVGADGAVVELPDGDAMVYRAVFGIAEPYLGLRIPRAGSLAGAALDTGQTLYCADTANDPRVDDEVCRRIGLRSMICVPLRHGADVVGVLKVFSGRAHAFAERDERTLELVGGLVASTVHRAQVEQRLAAHHAAAEALGGARSLEVGLAGALRGIGEQLGWSVGAVWLADDTTGALACVQTWHRHDLPLQPYLELNATPEPLRSGGLLATVLDTGSPAWLERVGAAPERSADPRRMAAAAACGLRTLVAVPILSRGETVGVVELGCRSERVHDGATLELLADIATQIGQFVQRRRAEERMAVQAANLAAVAELSQSLSHIEDPSATRPALCRAIRDLTQTDQVLLMEPDGAGRLVATGQDGGLLPADISVDLATGCALAIEVFHAGRGRFVADFEVETTHARAMQQSAGLRSAHYEPLVRDGKVTGVLVIATRTVRARDEGGVDALMRLLAAETASALAFSDLLATLDERARTDELTGVANRRTWEQELPLELSRSARVGKPISMAILDLDHFKAYNDTFGHPAGDRLLRTAAAAWTGRLRATDLLARYGGEEFAVLLPGCDETSAARVAETLRAAVPEHATCSIGIATWDGAESAAQLVMRADAALYAAKDAGRDRVVSAAV